MVRVRYNDGYDSFHGEYRRGSEHSSVGKILLLVLAVIFPPLAVFLTHGFRLEFWLNILFLILFYIPALIHAVWLIARR